MIEIHTQTERYGDNWRNSPSRAAGLYGELLPLPVTAPPSPALTRKPRLKASLTD